MFKFREELSVWLDALGDPDNAQIDALKMLIQTERLTAAHYVNRVKENLSELNAEIRFDQERRSAESQLRLTQSLEGLAKSQAETDEHLLKIAKSQAEIDEHLLWIEAFLVSVYAAHLYEMATAEQKGSVSIIGRLFYL